MNLNYNISAMRVLNVLNRNESKLSRSSNRLSSGEKITPSDDPASYAISRKMNRNIVCTKVATNTAANGISIIHVADGALTEVHSMLQRLKELSVKASNGILTEEDKSAVNEEASQLTKEIERIAGNTQFNGQNLLDGEFDCKSYVTVDGKSDLNYKVLYESDEIEEGKYEVKDGKVYKDGQLYINGTSTLDEDNILTIKDNNGKEFRIQTDGLNKDFEIESTKIGPMRLQVGTETGQSIDLRIPALDLRSIGLANLDLTNNPEKAMGKVDKAIENVSKIRSRLGAYENRLEHTHDRLQVADENLTNAYSTIMDTDIAQEMTEFSLQQILVQAGMSMLSQANDRPAQILQLLQ